MERHDSWQSLTRFYDAHPVNEDSILQQLESQGVALDTLSEEVLKDFDMDHFGGTDALDILAGKTGIQASSYVLDVCSGIGGPVRDAAEFLDAPDEWGTVTVGQRADLILVEANPLDDVRSAAKGVGVMVRGRWYPQAELQAKLDALAKKYAKAKVESAAKSPDVEGK